MIGNRIKGFTFALILYVTCFFGTIFLCSPCLLILPFNRKLYHTLSDFFLQLWLGLCVFLIEKFCGIDIALHLKNVKNIHKLNANSIVVMNHRTRLDWLFYFCVLYRINGLNSIKVILKDALRKIPGPGWAMQFSFFMFFSRKWELDKMIITRFIDYYKLIEKNVMILIFPEGTNITKDTKHKSDKFANANNLPLYKNVLHPRVTGFSHLYTEMKRNNMIEAINDVTIIYEDKTPENESEFLKGEFPSRIHFLVDVTKLPSVPEGFNSEKWLLEKWASKEQILEEFYSHNTINETYSRNMKLDCWAEGLLYVYAAFWILTISLILYSIYAYFYIRLYFIVTVVLCVIANRYFDGIDSVIMKAFK